MCSPRHRLVNSEQPSTPNDEATEPRPFRRRDIDDRARRVDVRSVVLNALTAPTPDAYRNARRLIQDLRSEPRDVELSRDVVQTIRDASADSRVAFMNFDLAIDVLLSAATTTADDVLEIVVRRAPGEIVGRATWRERALVFISARLAEVDQAKLMSTVNSRPKLTHLRASRSDPPPRKRGGGRRARPGVDPGQLCSSPPSSRGLLRPRALTRGPGAGSVAGSQPGSGKASPAPTARLRSRSR